MDKRMHVVQWGAGQQRKRTSSGNWKQPIRWNTQHMEFFATHGRRRRVFCASLADVFDNQVPEEWRTELFELIAVTPHLDWMLLTKRIGNAAEMLNDTIAKMSHGINSWDAYPWPNVWIGATVVNQMEADRDIPKLLETAAAIRFLSMEPLLGQVNLLPYLRPISSGAASGINQVIVGGESGSAARPMHGDWPCDIRDQCAAANIPFLYKQWGEWLPWHQFTPALQARLNQSESVDRFRNAAWTGAGWEYGISDIDAPDCDERQMIAKVGKKSAGRLLDGVLHDVIPNTAVNHGNK